MRIDVITLFPELIHQCVEAGVVGRAVKRDQLAVATWNPREFTHDRYRTVDARTYGGGPGMVMMVGPLREALAAATAADEAPNHVVYMGPQGSRLTQRKVRELAARPRLTLVCGRYEGVDARFLARAVDEELSIGDYVLSGGELAAAVVLDAVGRLQEGVLHDARSAAEDSFSESLLDCPHFTRPVDDAWGRVPEVLQSGDHAAIRRWRLKQALGRTWLRRPDLLAQCALDDASRALLEEFRREYLAAQRNWGLPPQDSKIGGVP